MMNDIIKFLKIKPIAHNYINNDLWLLYNDVNTNNRYRIIIHNDTNKYNVYIQYIYIDDSDVIDVDDYICNNKKSVAILIDCMMLYYMVNDFE